MLTATTTVPYHLPQPLAPMVGRRSMIGDLVALIRESGVHLVTLTGPGGVGKTRLAIRVAAELADRSIFPDGVWFVPLAPVADPALVIPTIAQVLGVGDTGDEPILARLQASLGPKRVLLVLDNFEQVVEAAPVVTDLLAAAPRLRILATSRVRLRVSGEREFAVPPLSLSRESRVESRETSARSHDSRLTTLDSEAVALFVERARAVRPDFALTDGNEAAVAEICRRLDGLPLAIELAAARVKVLSPTALLARLERRLPLLVSGARDLPSRQQTLSDAIAWSYDLLPPTEQALFRRLAVFVGGFTIEGAEYVGGRRGDEGDEGDAGETSSSPSSPSSPSVLDGLGSLADKSLLQQQDEADGDARLGMLETVREYALGQLEARGEAPAIRQAHAALFLDLAEQAEARFLSGEEAAWLDRLEPELDNLRAALSWAAAPEQPDPSLGLCLAAALWRFWQTRGHVSEGRRWLKDALDRDGGGATESRAKALSVAGNLAWIQKDEAEAAILHDESIAIWKHLGNQANVLRAFLRGLVAHHQEDDERLEALVREALPLFATTDAPVWTGATLVNCGVLEQRRGNNARARELLDDALGRYRALGFRWGVAWILGHLSRLASDTGDVPDAIARAQESLTIYRDHRDAWGMVEELSDLAALTAVADHRAIAARLFGAVEAQRETLGIPVTPADLDAHRRDVAMLRASLGDEAFGLAWAAGRGLALDDAVAEALAARHDVAVAPAAADAIDAVDQDQTGLTPREREVLRLLAMGRSNAEIGDLLFISPRTAGTHVTNILGKLGVGSRAAAVAIAHQRGMVQLTDA